MAVIKTQFTLRLNPIDHAKIKKIAEIENRSMTNMIETLIKQKIKQYESRNGEIPVSRRRYVFRIRRKSITLKTIHLIHLITLKQSSELGEFFFALSLSINSSHVMVDHHVAPRMS